MNAGRERENPLRVSIFLESEEISVVVDRGIEHFAVILPPYRTSAEAGEVRRHELRVKKRETARIQAGNKMDERQLAGIRRA